MKLLLVEDTGALCDMLAAHLRERGFTVDVARTDTQAMQAIGVGRYDVAILDLGLPDMDGMDLVRTLRGRPGAMPPALIRPHAKASPSAWPD
jgi:DNA-binding response OmpR family regulator